MKCLIIDDEEMAVKVIEQHISHINGLEVVGICHNAMDAFSMLQRQPVDLLFLDIQMPRMTGLNLIEALTVRPHIILTTAHREFALDGYDLDVVDYLLKPISFDRFMKAVGKVFRLGNNALTISTIPRIPSVEEDTPSFFYVKCDRQFVKILLEEVLYIESLRNHIRIVTTSDQFMPLMGIGQIEEKLPPQYFLRIHRSYIVSLSKIEQFSQSNISVAEKMLPIGNLYRQDVMRRLRVDMI